MPQQTQYLELELPPYLNQSLKAWIDCQKQEADSGIKNPHWDIFFNELRSDINCAEADSEITAAQAHHLREYLYGENYDQNW